MRYCVCALLLSVAAVAMTACQQEPLGNPPQQFQVSQVPQVDRNPQVARESPAGDHPQDNGNEEPLLLLDDEPPLLLDDEPLLLLDDDGEQSSAPTGPVADNSRCHHCHLNYEAEKLAVVHARANIGCAHCHGKCDEHIADESWASGGNGTPPEIMYPPDKINPFCFDCHPKDEMSTPKHKDFLAGTAKEKVCTDCHGEHRLVERKCKWK